ncbi:PAS domain-containing protein [Pseudoalteromonas sp. OOF1S-7]|uniref:PAS domain-containing protein n=1 Tax=Pseudoalteromonas sp. OOF1S-7 TaxID=2917757 RepID=UPI001EF4C956|nr:PAS domain-containing protein [Pseudoalteromonas sp. OOF1S-7]MCG7533429.1 PAS domain-containing protein [Pseudoalteromonas sp. OOF1S-7]
MMTKKKGVQTSKFGPQLWFKAHYFYWFITLVATVAIILFSYRTADQLTQTTLDASRQVAEQVTQVMQKEALARAQEKLELTAKSKTSQVQTVLNSAMSVVTTLAQTLAGMKDQGMVVDVGRDAVNSMLSNILNSHDAFFAIYSIWEPNQFDMLDLAYVNAPAHDASGRFASYWYRDSEGQLVHTVARGYSDIQVNSQGSIPGAYYQLPRRDKTPHVIDPYTRTFAGEEIPLMSLVAPIISQSGFIGIVGIDLKLDFLQRIALNYHSTILSRAQIMFVSHNGTLVASSEHPEQIGKPAGALIENSDPGLLPLRLPLHIAHTQRPWSVHILFDKSVIYQESQKLTSSLQTRANTMQHALEQASRNALFKQMLLASVLVMATFFILQLTTRLSKQEQALRLSEGRLQAILDNTSAVVYLKDKNSRYLMVNKKYEQLFNITNNDIYGLSDFDIFPAEVAQAFQAHDKQVLQQTHPLEVEEQALHPDGQLHTYISVKFPIYDKSGDFYGLCGISTDITYLKQTEQRVRELNAELELRVEERTQQLNDSNTALLESLKQVKSTQAKLIKTEKMATLSNMFAGIAHEMNTPLGVCVTAISHLQNCAKSVVQQVKNQTLTAQELNTFLASNEECCLLIMNNLSRSAELVESFKQISADDMRLDKSRFNIYATVSAHLDSLDTKLHDKTCKITLDCDRALNFVSYPRILLKVVDELVTNSLTHAFTGDEPGTIYLKIGVEREELKIHYRDNGLGIDQDILEHIFEPFITSKRHQGHVGLGMHIAYNLVINVLHGSIECHSIPEQGTEINISVPVDDD